MQEAPSSPVNISPPRRGIQQPASAQMHTLTPPGSVGGRSHRSSQDAQTPNSGRASSKSNKSPKQRSTVSEPSDDGIARSQESTTDHSRHDSFGGDLQPVETAPQLQYSAFEDEQRPKRRDNRISQVTASSSSSGGDRGSHLQPPISRSHLVRPGSAYSMSSDTRGGRPVSRLNADGNSSPGESPRRYARDLSSSRKSPGSRPVSYVDLLNDLPYAQQVAPAPLNNSQLQLSVGTSASLLQTSKTLEMYRANVKKTNDPAVQYEFALFMIHAARQTDAAGYTDRPTSSPLDGSSSSSAELIKEAKHILQKLSDRAYPFAQYYLGDGYSSGFFNKGKPDYDKAFPLFLAASKHGHAESSYRAALCYEFGWGTARSYAKAVQFFRTAASKNHPGAATRLGKACLTNDMGLVNRYREGVKWLKRAQESADFQYNAAPFELGLLHVTGYGDDIFKDEKYAAQLFTQSAHLGHEGAAMLLGEAYEHARLGCPRDPALSVHYYNIAAQAGNPLAMMALCAWYIVGAEPVMPKNEPEAYEWAKKAADLGLPKAEYACGYFTEMGIGCRRDPLEANVWYVRAADQGNELAKQRLAIIRAAASGDPGIPMTKEQAKSKDLEGNNKKECIVM
ncbi:Chitin synthase 4 [Elasticomyces elasticus]|nr:Chitin synthase 4 [Elasticomyces elasticus]